MQRAAKGPTLNKKILESVLIPIPSRSEQEAFIERMNDLEAGAINLRERASALDQEMLEAGRTFALTATTGGRR